MIHHYPRLFGLFGFLILYLAKQCIAWVSEHFM